MNRETLRNQRFVRLLESAGIRDERLAMDMSDEYLRISPTFNALMPHSKEVLEYLYDKGYPMSLITNGFNEVQFRKVECSGLKKFFRRITTSEFAGIGKPNPGIFEYAMRKAEVGPSECIMVGDETTARRESGSLLRLSPDGEVRYLKDLKFREFFAWLSRSIQKTSQSMSGEEIYYEPTGDWAEILTRGG